MKIISIKPFARLLAFLIITCGLQACIPKPDLPNLHESLQSQPIEDLYIAHIAAERLAKVYGSEHVLVIFDLDNTLLAMEENLGSDQWYEWQTKKLEKNDPRRVPEIFSTQNTLFYLGNMRPTQPDTVDIVIKLQKKGFPMIVVTSRDANARFSAFRELRRNNLFFRDSAFGPKGGYQQKFYPDGEDEIRPVFFQDGVLFVAGQDKGEVLMNLFEKTGWGPPKAVVFVDDKKENINAVINAFVSAKVEVQVFEYNGELERVKNFDGDEATKKWCGIEKKLLHIQAVFKQENFKLPDQTTKACEQF